MAWKVLRTLRDSVRVQEQDPCPKMDKMNVPIYNPYKKRYETRKPTLRSTKNEELQMTMSNNEYPSDVLWVGDRMEDQCSQGMLRIWMQNWNGAEKYSEDKIMYQLSTLIDNNINYFSIVESRLNQYNKEACNKWYKSAQRIIPQGEISITSSPGFPENEAHQPGGLISGFSGPLQSRYNTFKRDPMGRWHYHQFNGKSRDLRIYSLYRVNPGSDEQQGDTTAWSQQKKLLDYQNDDRNPRKAVTEDFIKEIQNAVNLKLSIIILADLNETITGPEKMNEQLRTMGLLNVMEERIGREALPRTCNKSNRAIDHIWVTGNIMNTIHYSGYAPFDFIKSSDHRGIYFDFSYKEILDENLHKLDPPRKRRLQSSIPNRVKKYMEVLEDQWEYHKITERFQELYTLDSSFTEEQERALNILDNQITEIMNYAERKCSLVPSHSIGAWSVKLKNAIRNVINCATRRTKAKKVKVGENIEEAIENFKVADQEWKDAKEEYKAVKKNTKQLRNDHIYECAVAHAERKENGDVDAEVRRLNNIEEQRNKAARMAFAMKPFRTKGSTTILIPAVSEYTLEERADPNFDHYNIDLMWEKIYPHNGKNIKHWERIRDKQLVQQLTVQWQRKHFTQATENPLGSTEWNDELTKKEVQEKILKGSYEIDNTTPIEIQELFDQMKRPQKVQNELSFTSSIDEFIAFIRGSSEKTTTSPSGRGYNHYKSMLVGGGRSQLEVIHGILELARHHNIIVDRWKTTVTTLMEKDVGSPKIHRMRSIHIIEAEVQYIAKLFYCKRLLRNAETLDLITDQQYGGRNKRQAQSVVLNKMMYYNITHQQLTDAAFMDDDARNCYDRILTALSAVELRSWGQSYEEAQFCVKFLQSQQYYVRTGLGISNASYTYSRESPTHGSGQGIGWAGIKFTRTSDSICKVMKKTCAGMMFEDPDKQIKVERNADIFVDDTAIGTTANRSNHLHILHQLKHDQQKHAYLLYASGHKLALDKCSYYLVRFIREGTRQRHCMNHEVEGQLKIKEGYGKEEKIIKRLQPFECHRTLGHYISVTNNQKRQKRELEKKITHWCDRLRTSYLSSEDTLYAYTGYLEPALKYMLSSSSLSYDDCDSLAKHIEGILLNAFTIQKNCARVVLYSPKLFGGLGIQHMYHLQGIEKLRFFKMHLLRNDTTGKLFRICMKWTQLEAGTKQHFFQERHDIISNWLTPTWITHLWEYIQTSNMELCLPNEDTPSPIRKNDFFLMDTIKNCPVSIEKKKIFNQIRLSLQVETAADIVCIASGTVICKSIYEGKNYRTSTKAWPKILPFPKKWIDTWQTLLRDYIVPQLQSRPLGSWLKKNHQNWQALTNSTNTVVAFQNKTYRKHGRTNYMTPSEENDQCTIEADVYFCNNGIKLESSGKRKFHQQQQILTTPSWIRRNQGTFTFSDDISTRLVNEMKNNNIIVATDGSVLHGKAAHAFCFATKDSHSVLALHAAPVDGDPNTMTSFRPEAMGALAAVTILTTLHEKNNLRDVTIPIYIDNSETIQVLENKKPTDTMSSVLSDHIDAAIQLQEANNSSIITFNPIHVKSHMDREDGHELTPSQLLNQLVDNHVGEFIRNPPPRFTPLATPEMLPSQQLVFLKSGTLIESNIINHIISSHLEHDIDVNLEYNHNINVSTKPLIEFEAIQRVLESNSRKLGKRVKNINYQWHTMHRCKQWGKSQFDLCPNCGKASETWNHVYECKEENMIRTNKENIKMIGEKMTQLKTLPALQQHFLHILQQPKKSLAIHQEVLASPYASDIQNAHQEQENIGLEAFHKGFLSKKWFDIQQKYYSQEIRDQKFNIQRWKKNIVRLIIDRGNSLWDERCTLVHLTKNGTDEHRYRNYLYDFLNEHRDRNELNVRDRHLLKRRRKYFFSAHISVLEMWHSRILAAIQRETERRKDEGDDITKFVIRKPKKRRRRVQRSHIPLKVYKQTTLWTTTTRTIAPITQQTTPQIALASKRKHRILQQLSHRRKRTRQSYLSSPKSPKKNKSIAYKKRAAGINTNKIQYPSKKRRSDSTKYVSIRERRSIRDKIRLTGKDTKNDR